MKEEDEDEDMNDDKKILIIIEILPAILMVLDLIEWQSDNNDYNILQN